MTVIDPKSMLIGVLITLLAFSTLGLRPNTDELGHLVVRSLTIEDDRGVIMGYLGNGYMQTYNQYGEPTLFIGTGKDGGGYMRSYNGNGDESAYVGTGRMGGGYIRTYNNSQKETAYCKSLEKKHPLKSRNSLRFLEKLGAKLRYKKPYSPTIS